jgi:hypothetical protein
MLIYIFHLSQCARPSQKSSIILPKVLNLLFGSHISFYLLHCYAFSKVHHICQMLSAHVWGTISSVLHLLR